MAAKQSIAIDQQLRVMNYARTRATARWKHFRQPIRGAGQERKQKRAVQFDGDWKLHR